MITELKSKIIVCYNFLDFSIVSFCHFQKRSSHLISQNSSPHVRHVSLDGLSVNHPIKVLEPDQNAGISRIVCESDGQNAGISRALEFLGFL